MPAIDQIVRINRIPYSWTDVGFRVAGASGGAPYPLSGFTKVSYKEKRERKLVYGSTQDGKPLGITDGKYSIESLSLEMLRQTWDALTDYACSQTGTPSYGDWIFTLTIQVYNPRLSAIVTPITDVISGVRLGVGVEKAHQEGIDELIVACECIAEFATEDGKQLWTAKSPIA